MQDLDSIVAGEEPVQEPAPEAQTEEPVTPAEPVEEPKAEADPEPAKETPMVPLAALQEVRGQLQELKAMMPQPEQPKAPDPLDDPQGYQAYQQQHVANSTLNVKLDLSEDMARTAHGDAVVDEAFQAFQATADQATRQAIMAARSPWNEVVKWHKQNQVAQEIGNDPAAYAAKVEAEIRAKVEAEMVAKQAKDKAAQAAPSMANVTGTGGGVKTSWAGPTSLEAAIGD